MQLQPSTNEVSIADSADSAEYQGILASGRLTLTAFVRYSTTADVSMMQAGRQQYARHPRSSASGCCHTTGKVPLYKVKFDSKD